VVFAINNSRQDAQLTYMEKGVYKPGIKPKRKLVVQAIFPWL
jgi:hypothetical protein